MRQAFVSNVESVPCWIEMNLVIVIMETVSTGEKSSNDLLKNQCEKVGLGWVGLRIYVALTEV